MQLEAEEKREEKERDGAAAAEPNRRNGALRGKGTVAKLAAVNELFRRAKDDPRLSR
jgi:hypothetical protein